MAKYRFVKDSKLERPRNISNEAFMSASYGDIFEYEPVDNPLKIYHLSGTAIYSDEYKVLRSLKNTINYYSGQDELYQYDSFRDKPISLYAFSTTHLGSGFEKGSVELNYFLSGNLISKVTDFREDGVLYSGSDEKVGIVLYKEGFILINNTSSLSNVVANFSSSYQTFQDNPKWIHAFLSASDSLYFDINYNTKNETPVNTYFISADKNTLNHSNNETYVESSSYGYNTGSYFFKESEEIKIKNISKSPFVSGSANFEKQTFISEIQFYDENKKLIAVGTLANPIRKTENREFVFKLKIDF